MIDRSRFFWSENILWKQDILGRQVTVSLSGQDLIVDTAAVGQYLAANDDNMPAEDDWRRREWTGQGLNILWFEDLDHAQVFDSCRHRHILVNVVREYSAGGGVCD